MLRAGPFSDERVVRLVNRRFVPVAFDLFPGAMHDAEGKAWLVERRPELAGNTLTNEPLLVFTPDGEVAGETDRYHDTRGVLAMLQRALRKHPAYDRPAAGEDVEALIDRQRYDEALARAGDDYTRGHIERLRGDFAAMEEHVAKVADDELADDVRMERAYRLWHGRRYTELRDHLKDFPMESNRAREARYFAALALYHLGRKDEALAAWSALVRGAEEPGPWVYRADWAYTNVRGGGGLGVVTSATKPVSLLGRLAYMGMPNPDLSGPGD